MAGDILFLVHTRSRHMDAIRITAEPVLDEFQGSGFIETATKAELTKNGQTAKRRGAIVSIVGLSRGVSGLPWAAEWLAARTKLGAGKSGG